MSSSQETPPRRRTQREIPSSGDLGAELHQQQLARFLRAAHLDIADQLILRRAQLRQSSESIQRIIEAIYRERQELLRIVTKYIGNETKKGLMGHLLSGEEGMLLPREQQVQLAQELQKARAMITETIDPLLQEILTAADTAADQIEILELLTEATVCDVAMVDGHTQLLPKNPGQAIRIGRLRLSENKPLADLCSSVSEIRAIGGLPYRPQAETDAAATKEAQRTLQMLIDVARKKQQSINVQAVLTQADVSGWASIQMICTAERSYCAIRFLENDPHVDPLTGAFNRSYLLECCPNIVECPHEQPVVCLFLDLDYFKAFNDTLNHAAGDEALRKFRQIISRILRRGDIVARFGGDEFVALLELSTKEIEAKIVSGESITLSDLAEISKESSHSNIPAELLEKLQQARMPGDTPENRAILQAYILQVIIPGIIRRIWEAVATKFGEIPIYEKQGGTERRLGVSIGAVLLLPGMAQKHGITAKKLLRMTDAAAYASKADQAEPPQDRTPVVHDPQSLSEREVRRLERAKELELAETQAAEAATQRRREERESSLRLGSIALEARAQAAEEQRDRLTQERAELLTRIAQLRLPLLKLPVPSSIRRWLQRILFETTDT